MTSKWAAEHFFAWSRKCQSVLILFHASSCHHVRFWFSYHNLLLFACVILCTSFSRAYACHIIIITVHCEVCVLFFTLSLFWTHRCVIWCAEIRKRSFCVPWKLWWMYCKKWWLNGWLQIKSHQSQYVGLVHGIISHFSVWLIVYFFFWCIMMS